MSRQSGNSSEMKADVPGPGLSLHPLDQHRTQSMLALKLTGGHVDPVTWTPTTMTATRTGEQTPIPPSNVAATAAPPAPEQPLESIDIYTPEEEMAHKKTSTLVYNPPPIPTKSALAVSLSSSTISSDAKRSMSIDLDVRDQDPNGGADAGEVSLPVNSSACDIPPWRRHAWLLLMYFLSFSSMGMGLSLVGPTFLVLARQVRERKMSNMAMTFLGRAGGFLTGTLAAGQVVDRCGKKIGQWYMIVCLLFVALFTITMTVVDSLALLIFNCFLIAFAMGAVDNIVQILLIATVKHDYEPYLQAIHAGFALGAFLSPVIIAGFVDDIADEHGSGEIDIDQPQSNFYKVAFYIIAFIISIPAVGLTILTIRYVYFFFFCLYFFVLKYVDTPPPPPPPSHLSDCDLPGEH